MKRIILLLTLGLLFTSCGLDDGEPSYTLEVLPVSQVDMPTAFRKDSITEIPLKYIRPTTCHFFDGFYYEINDFERTVGIYAAKSTLGNCQEDDVSLIEVPLRFKPTQIGTYHFKFLSGQNPNGSFTYLEYDVIVNH